METIRNLGKVTPYAKARSKRKRGSHGILSTVTCREGLQSTSEEEWQEKKNFLEK